MVRPAGCRSRPGPGPLFAYRNRFGKVDFRQERHTGRLQSFQILFPDTPGTHETPLLRIRTMEAVRNGSCEHLRRGCLNRAEHTAFGRMCHQVLSEEAVLEKSAGRGIRSDCRICHADGFGSCEENEKNGSGVGENGMRPPIRTSGSDGFRRLRESVRSAGDSRLQ